MRCKLSSTEPEGYNVYPNPMIRPGPARPFQRLSGIRRANLWGLGLYHGHAHFILLPDDGVERHGVWGLRAFGSGGLSPRRRVREHVEVRGRPPTCLELRAGRCDAPSKGACHIVTAGAARAGNKSNCHMNVHGITTCHGSVFANRPKSSPCTVVDEHGVPCSLCQTARLSLRGADMSCKPCQ